MQGIKSRLEALEKKRGGGPVYVLVALEDGSEAEVRIEEFAAQERPMRFRRFTRGFDPTYHDMELLWQVIERDVAGE